MNGQLWVSCNEPKEAARYVRTTANAATVSQDELHNYRQLLHCGTWQLEDRGLSVWHTVCRILNSFLQITLKKNVHKKL